MEQEIYLGHLVKESSKAFGHALKKELSKFGLPDGYGNVIRYLNCKQGPVNQKDIVEFSKCKPSTISVTLQNMENDKIIERKVSKTDKRRIDVTLTEKGKEISIQIWESMKKVENAIYNSLSEEEVQVVSTTIKRITNMLEKWGEE